MTRTAGSRGTSSPGTGASPATSRPSGVSVGQQGQVPWGADRGAVAGWSLQGRDCGSARRGQEPVDHAVSLRHGRLVAEAQRRVGGCEDGGDLEGPEIGV